MTECRTAPTERYYLGTLWEKTHKCKPTYSETIKIKHHQLARSRGKIPSEHLGQICEIAVLAWMRAVILRLAGIVEFRLHVSRGVESLGHGRIRNPRGPGLTVHHREVITTVQVIL